MLVILLLSIDIIINYYSTKFNTSNIDFCNSIYNRKSINSRDSKNKKIRKDIYDYLVYTFLKYTSNIISLKDYKLIYFIFRSILRIRRYSNSLIL